MTRSLSITIQIRNDDEREREKSDGLAEVEASGSVLQFCSVIMLNYFCELFLFDAKYFF